MIVITVLDSKKLHEILRLLNLRRAEAEPTYRVKSRMRDLNLTIGERIVKAECTDTLLRLVGFTDASITVHDLAKVELLHDGTITVWGLHGGLDKLRLELEPIERTDAFVAELNRSHVALGREEYLTPEQRREAQLAAVGQRYQFLVGIASVRVLEDYGPTLELTYPDGTTRTLEVAIRNYDEPTLILDDQEL